MSTREDINAHNTKVAAFRAAHHPRLDALTDDECRRIHQWWTSRQTAANRLALEFREELGGTWPDDAAVAIGIKMLAVVLERLDEYDADFRPRPEPVLVREYPGGGKVWYLPAEHRCRVVYHRLQETFRPDWNPRFGLDVVDDERAQEIVQRLKERLRSGAPS